MKIVVDINHPSHVHFFKNFIWEMEKKGHETIILVSAKDVCLSLLSAYGFPHLDLGPYGTSLLKKLAGVPEKNLKAYQFLRPLAPDIFLGLGSIRAAHVSWLMGKPSIIFDDDEYTYPFYRWFTGTVCAFSGFKLSGEKIIKVPGYKELAYLHPHRFQTASNSNPEDPGVLLRFVSWTAFHDLGKQGFSLNLKEKLVKELEKHARVYISSESPLPHRLEKYRVRIHPEDMHRFLSRVNLLVCDSQTMATEAAVLGVPAVRCNSFVGKNDMGNFRELEERYKLIFNYSTPEAAVAKSVELIKTPGLKAAWEDKRRRLLRGKIDVTAFMVWLVENYPDSVNEIRRERHFGEWIVPAPNLS